MTGTPTRRTTALSLTLVTLGGLVAAYRVAAQPPAPPPVPENAPPPVLDAPDDEVEVLNRGPIHEAFAAPITNDPTEGVIITKQPPAPIEEEPPELKPDGDNVVWLPGYWQFDEDEDDFLWVSGLWRDIPPGRIWVPGYWTQVDGGYQWIAGMWNEEETEELAYLPEPPSTLEQGPSSPAPADNYFWVPGCWVYREVGYAWRPGYWHVYQPDWVWVPSRYVYTPRGYLYVSGFWDYNVSRRGLCFAPVRFHHYHRPWRYRPVVALGSWQYLQLHLFVRPRYGSYVFGDYYGYNSVVPWYSYHNYRRGYDPLFVYLSVRHGPTYRNRLDGWHRHFHRHHDDRPRHTFRQQREFEVRRRDSNIVKVTSVSRTITELRRDKDSPLKLHDLSNDERRKAIQHSKDWQELAKRRVSIEEKGKREGRTKTLVREKFEKPEEIRNIGRAGRLDEDGRRRPDTVSTLPEIVRGGERDRDRDGARDRGDDRERGAPRDIKRRDDMQKTLPAIPERRRRDDDDRPDTNRRRVVPEGNGKPPEIKGREGQPTIRKLPEIKGPEVKRPDVRRPESRSTDRKQPEIRRPEPRIPQQNPPQIRRSVPETRRAPEIRRTPPPSQRSVPKSQNRGSSNRRSPNSSASNRGSFNPGSFKSGSSNRSSSNRSASNRSNRSSRSDRTASRNNNRRRD